MPRMRQASLSVVLILLLVISEAVLSESDTARGNIGCQSRTNREALCQPSCTSDGDCGLKEFCVCDGDCGASCVVRGTQCKGVPKVKNAKREVAGRNFRDTITYTCKESYTMFGKEKIACRGIGQWDRDIPRCVVACSDPGVQENTRRNTPRKRLSLFPKGTVLEYWCMPGFQSVEGKETIKCLDDGTWSGRPLKCDMKSCGTPEVPENGKVHPMKDSYKLGEKVYLSCDSGFTRRGLRMRMCGNDGWTKGDTFCSGKSCGDPGKPLNGKRIGLNFQFKSRVNFECNDGYELIGPKFLTCQSNQKWSSAPPTCKAVECPDPPIPENGQIDGVLVGTVVGDKVKIKCNEGLMLRGPGERVCQADGTWSGEDPRCTELTCPRPEFQGDLEPDKQEYSVRSRVQFSCSGDGELVGARSATCVQTLNNATWDQQIPQCYECNSKAIGFENGKIKKSQLSQGEVAFKYKYLNTPDPDKARLNGRESWCAYKLNQGYLQVDLQVIFLLNAVATQGDPIENRWVPYYLLEYSTDGNDWFTYQENGENKVLVGNNDRNTVKKNVLGDPIRARFVRIIPMTFLGKDYGCLRMELYGCVDPKECLGRGSAVWFREGEKQLTYLKGTITDVGESTVTIGHNFPERRENPFTMRKDIEFGMFQDVILPLSEVKVGDDVITMWKNRQWYYLAEIKEVGRQRALNVQRDDDEAWTSPSDFRARQVHELQLCQISKNKR